MKKINTNHCLGCGCSLVGRGAQAEWCKECCAKRNNENRGKRRSDPNRECSKCGQLIGDHKNERLCRFCDVADRQGRKDKLVVLKRKPKATVLIGRNITQSIIRLMDHFTREELDEIISGIEEKTQNEAELRSSIVS